MIRKTILGLFLVVTAWNMHAADAAVNLDECKNALDTAPDNTCLMQCYARSKDATQWFRTSDGKSNYAMPNDASKSHDSTAFTYGQDRMDSNRGNEQMIVICSKHGGNTQSTIIHKAVIPVTCWQRFVSIFHCSRPQKTIVVKQYHTN